MAHKSFKRAVNLDPIWFTLPDREENDVRFDCNDAMPAGVVLSFVGTSTAGRDDATPGGSPVDSVRDLFDAAVIETQHNEFWALVNDKKGKVDIGMLVEVASWLTEEYTARPTGQPSDSGPSGKPSGPGSTVGASPTVTTYSKPALTVASV
jgi:hypothetical protein